MWIRKVVPFDQRGEGLELLPPLDLMMYKIALVESLEFNKTTQPISLLEKTIIKSGTATQFPIYCHHHTTIYPFECQSHLPILDTFFLQNIRVTTRRCSSITNLPLKLFQRPNLTSYKQTTDQTIYDTSS